MYTVQSTVLSVLHSNRNSNKSTISGTRQERANELEVEEDAVERSEPAALALDGAQVPVLGVELRQALLQRLRAGNTYEFENTSIQESFRAAVSSIRPPPAHESVGADVHEPLVQETRLDARAAPPREACRAHLLVRQHRSIHRVPINKFLP